MNEIWPWFRKLNFLVGSHHFQGSKYFLKMFLGCMEAHAGWNEMIWKKKYWINPPYSRNHWKKKAWILKKTLLFKILQEYLTIRDSSCMLIETIWLKPVFDGSRLVRWASVIYLSKRLSIFVSTHLKQSMFLYDRLVSVPIKTSE